MGLVRFLTAVLAIAPLAACGSDPPTAPAGAGDAGPRPCVAGELTLESGACLAAGMQENGCPAGEVALEGGGCRAAGIPAELCGAGFEADGNAGCEPILPPRTCPEGLMAVPGETTCHEVGPCGAGTWGDIPTTATTQHVDQSYIGGNNDGSPERPWTTIMDGVLAAGEGDIVAVAAGKYDEDVIIAYTPVILWGRCPSMVEIAGIGTELETAVIVFEAPPGTVIRGLAVTGPFRGVYTQGGGEVLVENVWVHDTADFGIVASSFSGANHLIVRSSLVESAVGAGIIVQGISMEIDGVVVRGTQPQSNGWLGTGIHLQLDDEDVGASGVVRSSVVEANHTAGVWVWGSDATIEASVVRDTSPDPQNLRTGYGIVIADDADGSAQRGNGTVRSSLIERNFVGGVAAGGSDMTLEAVHVRDTRARLLDGIQGGGIVFEDDPGTGQRSSGTARHCLAERNEESAYGTLSSDVTFEGVLARDTLPRPADLLGGRGFSAFHGENGPSNVVIRSSLVERSHEIAVAIGGSDVTIDGLLVRDTKPQVADDQLGRAIHIQDETSPDYRAKVTIRSSLLDGGHDTGLMVVASDAIVEATHVRGVQAAAADGNYGDGVSLTTMTTSRFATLSVRGSRIETAARTAVTNFGGTALIEWTAFECNPIDLDREYYAGQDGAFDDRGGNVCACKGASITCQVQTTNLAPPKPVEF